jgi:hypothetical protein
VKGLKDKIASENEVVRQIYKQITPTFDPGDDGIWSEIDLLEGDPMHRGVAMKTILPQSRRRRVARSLGEGHV